MFTTNANTAQKRRRNTKHLNKPNGAVVTATQNGERSQKILRKEKEEGERNLPIVGSITCITRFGFLVLDS
ncbi:MAG: hypothetical protein QXR19_08680 [Candidatus Jordarchaeaceae archaeon]